MEHLLEMDVLYQVRSGQICIDHFFCRVFEQKMFVCNMVFCIIEALKAGKEEFRWMETLSFCAHHNITIYE